MKKVQSKKSIRSASGTSQLAELRNQVAASASLDHTLDGSALWVLLALYRTFAVLDNDQSEEVASLGLTNLQFNILTTLQRARTPLAMGALAAMLVVRPTNLSGNINTLSERGFVRRELNLTDQRSLLAVLTKDGEEFLATNLPAHWRRLERLLGGLSREQRITLVSLLDQLARSIQIEHDEPTRRPKEKAREQMRNN